jgi:hypothetical protein
MERGRVSFTTNKCAVGCHPLENVSRLRRGMICVSEITEDATCKNGLRSNRNLRTFGPKVVREKWAKKFKGDAKLLYGYLAKTYK